MYNDQAVRSTDDQREVNAMGDIDDDYEL